jgi:hypothetical protein
MQGEVSRIPEDVRDGDGRASVTSRALGAHMVVVGVQVLYPFEGCQRSVTPQASASRREVHHAPLSRTDFHSPTPPPATPRFVGRSKPSEKDLLFSALT